MKEYATEFVREVGNKIRSVVGESESIHARQFEPHKVEVLSLEHEGIQTEASIQGCEEVTLEPCIVAPRHVTGRKETFNPRPGIKLQAELGRGEQKAGVAQCDLVDGVGPYAEVESLVVNGVDLLADARQQNPNLIILAAKNHKTYGWMASESGKKDHAAVNLLNAGMQEAGVKNNNVVVIPLPLSPESIAIGLHTISTAPLHEHVAGTAGIIARGNELITQRNIAKEMGLPVESPFKAWLGAFVAVGESTTKQFQAEIAGWMLADEKLKECGLHEQTRDVKRLHMGEWAHRAFKGFPSINPWAPSMGAVLMESLGDAYELSDANPTDIQKAQFIINKMGEALSQMFSGQEKRIKNLVNAIDRSNGAA